MLVSTAVGNVERFAGSSGIAIHNGSYLVGVCVYNYVDGALVRFADGHQHVHVSPRSVLLHPVTILVHTTNVFVLPIGHNLREVLLVLTDVPNGFPAYLAVLLL